MDEQQQYINQALQQDWEIDLADKVSKEEIIGLLAMRIGHIIERTPEAFFQLMYRLDIPEQKLNNAMKGMISTEEIAEMVYNRQLQKAKSRLQYKQDDQSKDKDLDW
ncbi:MAG: hypothetical protein R2800_13110 [Flavipsychrobacter sp.]